MDLNHPSSGYELFSIPNTGQQETLRDNIGKDLRRSFCSVLSVLSRVSACYVRQVLETTTSRTRTEVCFSGVLPDHLIPASKAVLISYSKNYLRCESFGSKDRCKPAIGSSPFRASLSIRSTPDAYTTILRALSRLRFDRGRRCRRFGIDLSGSFAIRRQFRETPHR